MCHMLLSSKPVSSQECIGEKACEAPLVHRGCAYLNTLECLAMWGSESTRLGR